MEAKALTVKDLIPAVTLSHQGIERLTKSETWAIDADEAETLATRLAAYLSHTKIKMDPKSKDLGLLLYTLFIMEVPRLSRYMDERRRKLAEGRAQAQAQAMASGRVVPMGPNLG